MDSYFYDITLSYEDNYKKGPHKLEKLQKPQFNTVILASDPARRRARPESYSHPARDAGSSPSFSGPRIPSGLLRTSKSGVTNSFLGFPIRTPFGIPAGPLLNSKFMKAAFEWGYDVSSYKTVRASSFPCHPFPNVVYVDTPKELHPEQTQRVTIIRHSGLSRIDSGVANAPQNDKVSITNSFGVPSQISEIWQEDVKKSLSYVGKDQLMILSFMGTVKENQTQQEFIDDFALAARLSKETGAKVLEANLSCPNIGNEGLVCYNLEATEAVTKAIRKAIGNTPLILKVGYYKDEKQLEKLTEIADRYADAIASINTVQAEVVDKDGKQALPGNMRLRSGICGASIKWAGLEMVQKFDKIRKQKGYKYEIVGIGGVMTPEDYFEYKKAGADLVQSATGAMWNPYLAYEILKKERE